MQAILILIATLLSPVPLGTPTLSESAALAQAPQKISRQHSLQIAREYQAELAKVQAAYQQEYTYWYGYYAAKRDAGCFVARVTALKKKYQGGIAFINLDYQAKWKERPKIPVVAPNRLQVGAVFLTLPKPSPSVFVRDKDYVEKFYIVSGIRKFEGVEVFVIDAVDQKLLTPPAMTVLTAPA